MAVSGVQGYVKSLNLAETSQDRQALNNLGGAPIADDIALFINNTKNESVLLIKVSEYNSLSGTIIINNTTLEEGNLRSSVFTDRDTVQLRTVNNTPISTTLYIKESNGVNTFNLSTKPDLSDTFIFFPTENFLVVRHDEVTLANLKNIAVSVSRDTIGSGIGTTEGQGYSAIENLNSAFAELYNYLDIANYDQTFKYISSRDLATDQTIFIEGVSTIKDPSNTIVAEGITATSPGLYLTDPNSNINNISRVRAFSSNSNPWTDDFAGTLSTDATSVTTGELTFLNGIKLAGVTVTTTSGTVTSSNFKNKVKVNINGIDYYLCLTT